ncbi:hypothetical protein NM688_g5317 [Phlebia brevispora]|uniref:Uncharacterized protein n=1 Tax=Phlebia brevispora TaxID=194682 RepID=A0ACC1SXA7_9APHY|nr:hypothetical protein NM688_g5317 [Phlebia brevispora]
MTKAATDDRVTVTQVPFIITDLSIKDLLSAIPAHCFKRSFFRSSIYVVWDFALVAVVYKTAAFLDTLITPEHIELPNPFLYSALRFILWAFYAFAVSLPMTGLWVCAHECGHRAFCESTFWNDVVGWILHSGLGVPYHSWRVSHAQHHASTGHMTEDQVFVPKTRSQLGLPAFKPEGENLEGSSVSREVMNELWEAIGDTPIMAAFGAASYLLFGWPLYLIINASGQKRYPAWSNHFNPSAVMYRRTKASHIILSDIGVFIWAACIAAAINKWGFADVFRLYLAPYLWVNHWLILITFLQHTDPILPHFRAGEFNFQRGALSTLDRNLLGELGRFAGWIGGGATHGISETHVLHHIYSKIPHYHAWEAADALRKRLAQAGIELQGRPGGWIEMYRVFRECKFVEDEGDIVFYKNGYGQAAARPVFPEHNASDSGIEIESDKKTD